MSKSIKVIPCNGSEYLLDAEYVDRYTEFNKYFLRIQEVIQNNDKIDKVCFISDDNFNGELCLQFLLKRRVMFSPGPAIEKDLSNLDSVVTNVLNAWSKIDEEATEKEQYEGVFNGKKIRFNRIYGGYRFTDEECEMLLEGKTIVITLEGNNGKYRRAGYLDEGFYGGFKYYGFKWDKSIILCPLTFANYEFSEEELNALDNGKVIHIKHVYSKKKNKYFDADIQFNKKEGKFEIVGN